MKSKLTSILLSVAIAFGIWLYVITTVSPNSEDTYYNIPVVMEGESVLEERGLMVTAKSSTSVTLKLSGNRSDLHKVNSGNITLKADLSKIYDPGTQIPISYNISYPGEVASNAFVVESQSPKYIYITVEKRVTKEVPVEVKWIGSAPEGFITDRENSVLDYPAVTISGPSSVADQIEKAVIEVDLTEQRESISQSYRYTLCDADDNPVDAQLITTNVEEVRLEVKIQRVKDVALTYNLIEGGGADSGSVQIDLSVGTIRVSGSEAALEALGDQIIIGTINLGDIPKDTKLPFTITLPEGITNLTGVTEVEATVRFKGLSTKEFTVENIRSVNVPEGMAAELITEKLTVTVRGPSADISGLTAEDISVAVDFTNAQAGTTTFKATILFSDGFGKVGALGSYSVSATVTEEAE